MQKQKIALIAQATYTSIEYGLYKSDQIIQQATLDKMQAASKLMVSFNTLLQNHNLNWQDISFIGVNQGPAPFTTLRALIATINGISFATKIPLIGIDGLVSFLTEQKTENTVVLLNAFAQDVYFAHNFHQENSTGWANGKEYLYKLKQISPEKPIYFVGNAVNLLQDYIIELFGTRFKKNQTIAQHAQLKTIADHSFSKYNNSNYTTHHLQPLYLKTQIYKPSC